MLEQPTLTKKILKASSVVLFFTIISSPLGYLLRIIYSHTLSIENYGLFYAVIGFLSVFITYKDLGFGFSVSYFVPKYFKEKDYLNCWKIYLYAQIIEAITSIIIAFILILSANWLSINYFKVAESEKLIYIFCIYLITDSFLATLNRMFMGLQQEIFYSSISFTRLFFTLTITALFWLFDIANIYYYALAWSCAYLITSIIYNFIFIKKNNFLLGKVNFDKKILRMMFAYAMPTLITTSIYTFISFTDTFFLTIFKGVKEVGIYNIALPIVSISSIFLSPLNNLFVPLVPHLMEGERDKVVILINLILKIIPFIGFYFALFLILFPSAPVKFLFGDKWVGLVETPLMILSIGFIASAVSSYMTTVVSGMGKVTERLKSSMILAILSIFLNMVLVYFYGVTGAIIANSIVYLLSVFLFGRIISKIISFKYPYIFYLKLAGFSFILIAIIRASNFFPNTWILFISSGIVYTLIVMAFGYYLKLFDFEILKFMLNHKDA